MHVISYVAPLLASGDRRPCARSPRRRAGTKKAQRAAEAPRGVRPISLLRLSLLRFVGSNLQGNSVFGRAILYITTTQRLWCVEAFVSILAHSQSQILFPGGGGV